MFRTSEEYIYKKRVAVTQGTLQDQSSAPIDPIYMKFIAYRCFFELVCKILEWAVTHRKCYPLLASTHCTLFQNSDDTTGHNSGS